MDWSLFGLNPKFKDFMEAHPDKTIIGMIWSMYWRFVVLIIAIEIAFIVAVMILGVTLGVIFHH